MPNPNPEIDVRRLGMMDPKITVLPGVAELLGGESFPRCESPSLRLEKIVRVGGDSKKDEVSAVVACHQKNAKRIPPVVPKDAVMFSAKLGARLIINQAGGVLENAGLCLHRHYGDPYIPGSAVKGIARHAAWCEWRDEQDDGKKQQIAQRIVRVFGYPTGDKALDDYLCPDKDKRVATAGNVCFFAAVPEGRVALAVDIVNCHHSEYYGGKRPQAFDDESPNPQFFPVIEEGAIFSFCLKAVGSNTSQETSETLLMQAKNWLLTALTLHGAGAKTVSGYGWFIFDSERDEREAEERRLQQEKDAQAERLRLEEEARLATLDPVERETEKLLKLASEPFAHFAKELSAKSEEERRAFVRVMRHPEKKKWWKMKQKKDVALADSIRAVAEELGETLT